MIEVVEPASATVMAEVPRAGVEEVDEAVARAKAAFPAWRSVDPGERAKLLHGLAEPVGEPVQELGPLAVIDGAPRRPSRPGAGDRIVDLLGAGPRNLRHHLGAGRFDHLDHPFTSCLAASTSDPITFDLMSSSGCQRTPSAYLRSGSSIASTIRSVAE